MKSIAIDSWFGFALGSLPWRVLAARDELRSFSLACLDVEGDGEMCLSISSNDWRHFLQLGTKLESIVLRGLSQPVSNRDMQLLCTY